MEELKAEFKKIVLEEYSQYCKSRGESETIEGLLDYQLNKNLIDKKTIKRFVIVQKYPNMISEKLGSKQIAIWELEDLTGICSRQIWNIIKRFSNYFRHQNRLVP